MLEPEIVEVVEGRAEVRQIFKVGKSTVIAGCYVTDGRIVRTGGARCGAAARSSRPTGSSRCAGSGTTSARSPRLRVRHRPRGYNDLVEGDIIECFTTQTGSRIAG